MSFQHHKQVFSHRTAILILVVMTLLKPCILLWKFKRYGLILSVFNITDFTFVRCSLAAFSYCIMYSFSSKGVCVYFKHTVLEFLVEYYLKTRTEIGKKLKTSWELKVKFLLWKHQAWYEYFFFPGTDWAFYLISK